MHTQGISRRARLAILTGAVFTLLFSSVIVFDWLRFGEEVALAQQFWWLLVPVGLLGSTLMLVGGVFAIADRRAV